MFSSWIETNNLDTPDTFDRNQLLAVIRSKCFKHSFDDPYWGSPSHQTSYDSICHELMNWGLDADTLPALVSIHREHRHALLKRMVSKQKTLSERYSHTIRLVRERSLYFAGWDRLCSEGTSYQLGVAHPWHGSCGFLQIMKDVRAYSETPEVLQNAGYRPIDQASWRERRRDEILSTELNSTDVTLFEVTWLAHALVLLTAKSSVVRSRPQQIEMVREYKAVEYKYLLEQFKQAAYVRVPFGLYQVHRHHRALQSVYLSSRNETLRLQEGAKSPHIRPSDSGVRVFETGERDLSAPSKRKKGRNQLMMFIDEEASTGTTQKSFVSLPVPFEEISSDPITNLVATIKKYPIDNLTHFEHMPRVLAGMFTAAHRDRVLNAKISPGSEGVFWDTMSGKRLCALVGFDPKNKKQLHRVTSMRRLLEDLTLHRRFRQPDEAGIIQNIEIAAPIIEPRNFKLTSDIRDIEGLNRRHVWKAWSLEGHLWQSTLDAKKGGNPAFMLLDERAFELKTSAAFNLYWTLINRAYFLWRDPHTRAGHRDPTHFTSRLEVIYKWAGMERAGAKVQRQRAALHDGFDEMLRYGLIDGWECDVLDLTKKGIDRDTMLGAELTVKLPQAITSVVAKLDLDAKGPFLLDRKKT